MSHKELISAYSKIDRPSYKPTILEIARQSTKELVWSRLLAHFLEPERGHRISSVWMRSIFNLSGLTYREDRVESVDLEVRTENNNLIDIVITTTNYVIAVENKIYAGLYNDLDDYRNHCEIIASASNKTGATILLSLTPYSMKLNGGFCNILWTQLQQEVKAMICKNPSAPFDQQTFYQNEFLAMMESVVTQNKVNAELIEFVVGHQNELKTLFSDLENIRDHLSTVSNEFQEKIKPYIDTSSFTVKQYRERKNPLFAVTYFDATSSDGIKIAVDVVFEPKGTTVEIFSRDRSKLARFLPKFSEFGIETTNLSDNRQLWVQKFSSHDEVDVIATQVSALLEKISGSIR